MTDVVERDLQALGARRRAAYGARRPRGCCMALGAVALLMQRGSLAGRRRGRGRRGGAGDRRDRALAGPARARGRRRRRLDGRRVRRGGRADAGHRRATFFGPPVAAAGGGALLAGLVCAGRASARAAPWSSPRSWSARCSSPPACVMQAADLRPRRRADHGAGPGRPGRQRLPVAGARRHRHHRRPALLDRRHHRRPRRDRPARASAPTPGSPTRSWSPSPATVGPAARAGRPARGRPRRSPAPLLAVLALPGRHAAHPAVPHRLRGPGRPGLRHRRPGLRRRSRCCGCIPTGARPPPWCWRRPAPSCWP